MSQREHDSLQMLPRATASPGFTDEVLRRIRRERPAPIRRSPFTMRLAAAAVAFAFLLGGIQFVHAELVQRQRIASLRSERRQIEAELEAVRRMAHESEPVVVLEDGKGTRVVMDLDTNIEQTSLTNYD